MPLPLDYMPKPAEPRLSKLAVLAFAAGLTCVPLAVLADYLLVSFAQSYHLPYTRTGARHLGMALWGAFILFSFVLCIGALVRLRRGRGQMRGTELALAGLLVCVLWLVLFLLGLTVGV